MKKTFILIGSVVTLLFALSSCNSNNLDLDKTLKFSTQTVEQQKQSIEQNGIDLLNKIDAMKNAKAMVALVTLSNLGSGSPEFIKPVSELRTNLLTNNVKAVETFNQQMRVAAALGDDVWGVWTWSSVNEKFVYVAGSSKTVTYLFPASENSTSNNGELKITYVQSNVVAPGTDPIEYMPKTITVVLKVSGAVALKADYAGSYKTDGTPTKVTQTLEIEKYNWNIELTNDAKDVSAKYEFKYGKEVLLKYEVGAAGSFTATNIENSMNDGNPENVMTSGAMYFQVMNIAVLGGFKDFKGFANDMKAINYTGDKSSNQKQVDALNKYVIMYGLFVKEKKKFAEVEFYGTERTQTDYNYNTGQYETKIVYELQPRFVLSDGSKVAIEDFFATGFQDLIDKMKSFK